MLQLSIASHGRDRKISKSQYLALDLAENWSTPVHLGREINLCFIPSIRLWVLGPFLIWEITTKHYIGPSTTTNFPPEISTSLSFFIYSPGDRKFRTIWFICISAVSTLCHARMKRGVSVIMIALSDP